jgi:hypothetical protein
MWNVPHFDAKGVSDQAFRDAGVPTTSPMTSGASGEPSRRLNPAIQDFSQWLAQNKQKIPLE